MCAPVQVGDRKRRGCVCVFVPVCEDMIIEYICSRTNAVYCSEISCVGLILFPKGETKTNRRLGPSGI